MATPLARIAAQQRLLQRRAEADLARIAAEAEALGRREAALVEAAGEDGPLGPLCARTAGARLVALPRERAALQAREAQTRDTLLRHARRATGAENRAAKRDAQAEAEAQRAELAAVVEAIGQEIGQGLGKPGGPS